MAIPMLYILMRNDLESMNCGKAIAQGSHAANAFVHHFQNTIRENGNTSSYAIEDLNKSFHEWENSTNQGFGTVIVLEGDMTSIEKTVDKYSNMGYLCSKVFDPTYPIIDGSVVHHIPLDTCAYLFLPDKDQDVEARETLKSQFKLHR